MTPDDFLLNEERCLKMMTGQVDPNNFFYQPKEKAYEDLKKATGQDFGYDLYAWYEWMLENKLINTIYFSLEEVLTHRDVELGEHYCRLKNFESARIAFENAFNVYRQTKPTYRTQAYFFHCHYWLIPYLISSYHQTGRSEEALQILEECRKDTQSEYLYIIIDLLASYYYEKQDFPTTLELCYQNLELLKQSKHSYYPNSRYLKIKTYTLGKISFILFFQGTDLEAALDYAQQAKALFAQIKPNDAEIQASADRFILKVQNKLQDS